MTPKPWYQSKTIWFGLLQIAAAVAPQVSGPGVPPAVTPYLGATGILTLILRALTRTAIK